MESTEFIENGTDMMNLEVSLAPEFCVIAFHQPEYNDVLA